MSATPSAARRRVEPVERTRDVRSHRLALAVGERAVIAASLARRRRRAGGAGHLRLGAGFDRHAPAGAPGPVATGSRPRTCTLTRTGAKLPPSGKDTRRAQAARRCARPSSAAARGARQVVAARRGACGFGRPRTTGGSNSRAKSSRIDAAAAIAARSAAPCARDLPSSALPNAAITPHRPGSGRKRPSASSSTWPRSGATPSSRAPAREQPVVGRESARRHARRRAPPARAARRRAARPGTARARASPRRAASRAGTRPPSASTRPVAGPRWPPAARAGSARPAASTPSPTAPGSAARPATATTASTLRDDRCRARRLARRHRPDARGRGALGRQPQQRAAVGRPPRPRRSAPRAPRTPARRSRRPAATGPG